MATTVTIPSAQNRAAAPVSSQSQVNHVSMPDFGRPDPSMQHFAHQQHVQQPMNHEPAAAWVQPVPTNGAIGVNSTDEKNFSQQAREWTDNAKGWTESAGRTIGSWTTSAGSFLGTKVAEAQEAMGLNTNAQSVASEAESMEKGIEKGGLPLPASSHSEKTAWQQAQESAGALGSAIANSASVVGGKISEQTSKLMQRETS